MLGTPKPETSRVPRPALYSTSDVGVFHKVLSVGVVHLILPLFPYINIEPVKQSIYNERVSALSHHHSPATHQAGKRDIIVLLTPRRVRLLAGLTSSSFPSARAPQKGVVLG